MLESDTNIDNSLRQSYIESFRQVVRTFEQMKVTFPKIEISDTNPNNDGKIHLTKKENDNGVFFEAEWNNISLRTIFDTGAGGCYIWNRDIANQIGVRFPSSDTTLLNGNIKALQGIIDDLKLGKFTIKNIPVFVSMEEIDHNDPRQVKCDSMMNNSFDIVLGLPVIMKLGIIELDFEENTLSFPKRENIILHAKNMFIENYAAPTVKMKVAEEDFTALFDTGNGIGIAINSQFYHKNRHNIPLVENPDKEKKVGGVGGCNAASFTMREVFDCKNLKIQINDTKLTLNTNCEATKAPENDYRFATQDGGAMGAGIFDYCKKAVFDFKNMNFSVYVYE